MFARILLLSVAVAALVGYNTVEALQPAVSNRRSFVGKLVAGTTGAAVAASTTFGGAAWAAEDSPTISQPPSGYTRYARRTGAVSRENSDLNETQDKTTVSLLDKMGLADVKGAADTSAQRRGQVSGRKSYSGMNTVYGSV